MSNKLCLIFNIASSYRKAIYSEIDHKFDCDWFFEKNNTDIKEFDIKILNNCFRYKSYGNPSILYWQGALIPCLFKKKYNTYIIITEDRSISYWLFMLLKSLFFRKKNIYGWSHGLYGRESKLRKAIERWRINNMAGQFVYNNRAKSLITELGIPSEKIHIIGNSLDYDTQLTLRNSSHLTDVYRNHFGNLYPVIIFIGRLTKVKKLDILLSAIYKLNKQSKYFNLILVGDGTEKNHLEGLVNQYGLHNQVWFYGACYDEKINAELVYNATLCVSPGNVGLTAIHALMFGTPVITNDDFTHQMPEFEAIRPNDTGDLFVCNNADDLAIKIDEWITNHTNREIVRKACYNEIDNKWNPHKQINVITSVIKSI